LVENNSENIDNNEKIDAEMEEIENENEVRRDFQNDTRGAEDLQREKSVYCIDEAFFLEVRRKEHEKPEIVDTNKKMENLRTYKTIEVLDEKEIKGTDETSMAEVMNAITSKRQLPL